MLFRPLMLFFQKNHFTEKMLISPNHDVTHAKHDVAYYVEIPLTFVKLFQFGQICEKYSLHMALSSEYWGKLRKYGI